MAPGPGKAFLAFVPGHGYIQKEYAGRPILPGPSPVSSTPMATPFDLLQALSRAYDVAGISPSGDPRLTDALEDVRDAQRALGWVVVRVLPEGLWAGGGFLQDPSGDLDSFRVSLASAGIQEIRFQDILEPEVLEDLLRRLGTPGEGSGPSSASRFRGFESDLGLSFASRREGPLPGMPGSIQALFGPAAARSAEGEQAPAVSSFSASRVAPEPAPADLPEETLARVRAFLRAPAGNRAAPREELQKEVARLRDARSFPSVASVVEHLVGSAGDDREVVDLARELMSPAVASHIVAKLGTTRDEGERSRLIQAASHLGGEMARALADALGEARDRFQRRTVMDAMIALGPVGVEAAVNMVEDPRWFVVRNGVALLGELGGEEAVAQVTGTLANTDSRVRREGVLALAKLGGEDANLLLLGMLDDGEAEVRAVACRALGALKVEKALKPLLRLLEADSDEDVQVEGLHALGQIGDPGAVPFIEKRAVGGLLSRPSREVRIAAFRALAGIGAPHALGLLEKATRDSDTGVRTVARSLLEDRRG